MGGREITKGRRGWDTDGVCVVAASNAVKKCWVFCISIHMLE